MPTAERLHRASKLAGRAAVYTHRDIRQVARADRRRSASTGPTRSPSTPSIATASRRARRALERRTALTVSVIDGQLYLAIGEAQWTMPLVAHRLS